MCHARIRIPQSLQQYTGGNGEILVDGKTVAEALASLYGTYEAIMDQVLDGDGNVHRHLGLELDGKDIRTLEGLTSRLESGDVLSIIHLEQTTSTG